MHDIHRVLRVRGRVGEGGGAFADVFVFSPFDENMYIVQKKIMYMEYKLYMV